MSKTYNRLLRIFKTNPMKKKKVKQMKKRVKKELKKILERKLFRDSLLILSKNQRIINKCDSCHRESCAC